MLPLTHILLDAARMGEKMEEAKQLNPKHDSLYRGTSEETLAVVAPYIFPYAATGPFGKWYMETGWGDSWGILLKSSWPMPELHKHFRKFLLVKTEEGKELYFRFYDPRVLRIFLPTCDAAQIQEFFGPIDYFVMEDEDPAYAIRFWHENAVLKSQRFLMDGQTQELPAKEVQPPSETKPKEIFTALNINTNTTSKPKSKWDLFD